MLFFFYFFFQAEDGIRDLVRSRGLGDVYKRQTLSNSKTKTPDLGGLIMVSTNAVASPITAKVDQPIVGKRPVSYTHLTLPTSDLV